MAILPTDVLFALLDQRYLTVYRLPAVADRAGKILVFDDAGDLQVMAPISTNIVYQGGVSADTVIKSDATGGLTVVPILAANDEAATVTVIVKALADVSGNASRITPAAGTIAGMPYLDIVLSQEAVRIWPDPDDNNWYLL